VEGKMQKLKLLFRNLNLLNIILIVAVLLMVYHVVLPMLNTKVKYMPVVPKKTSTIEEEPVKSQITLPSDYTIIAEQNLFHPDRKIPIGITLEEKPMPKPEFVLYGTLISEDISLAYLEDRRSPRTTPGRGKRQIALREGDALSGYTLVTIEHDKVVMEKGEETLVLKVVDSSVKKDRRAQAPAQVKKTPTRQRVKRPTPPPPRPDRSVRPTPRVPTPQPKSGLF